MEATRDQTTAEEWRPIVGWEGLYEVSSLGRVKSLPRQGTAGGLRKLALRPDGYMSVWLQGMVPGKKTGRVHRLVTEAFRGQCPAGMEVRHLDGNRSNNHLSNLQYGTRSENARDALRHGTNPHASMTHCIQGHEFDAENTYRPPWAKGRSRVCRECSRRRWRERKARLVAAGQWPNPDQVARTKRLRSLKRQSDTPAKEGTP